jgi:hypothetical protein
VGRRCLICDHPERVAIDRALVSSTLRKVAQQFGVGESNLYRHRKNCMAVALALKQEEHGRDLKRELLKLSSRAERLADEAERKGQLHAAISAIRELSRLVAMEATFYPNLRTGKIPVADIQTLVDRYNRGELETDEDETVIEIEGSSVPEES